MSNERTQYATGTLDFSTDNDEAALLDTDGRDTITVTVDGDGDTGDFDLEYTPDGSTWHTWKSYSSTGDVNETVTIAAREARLKTTAAGSGNADVTLSAT